MSSNSTKKFSPLAKIQLINTAPGANSDNEPSAIQAVPAATVPAANTSSAAPGANSATAASTIQAVQAGSVPTANAASAAPAVNAATKKSKSKKTTQKLENFDVISENQIDNDLLACLKLHGFIIDSLGQKNQWNRCPTTHSPCHNDGSYKIYDSGYCSYINWATDKEHQRYYPKKGVKLSKEEEKKLFAQIAEDVKKQQEERKKQWAEAAKKALKIYSIANDIRSSSDHQYLMCKGLSVPINQRNIPQPKIYKKSLIIPVLSLTLSNEIEISSLLYITENGKKTFLSSGRIQSCFYYIMGTERDKIAIAEGYATGVSFCKATGISTYIAFSAHNVLNVARLVLEKIEHKFEIIFAADWDKPNEKYPNPGGCGYATARNAVNALIEENNKKTYSCEKKFLNLSIALPKSNTCCEEKLDFNDLAVFRNENGRYPKIIDCFLERDHYDWLADLKIDRGAYYYFTFKIDKEKESDEAKEGLFKIVKKKIQDKWVEIPEFVAMPFSVEARGSSYVDGSETNTGTFIKWKTENGTSMYSVIYDRDLSSRDTVWFNCLRDGGLRVPTEKIIDLRNFFDKVHTKHHVIFVNKTGLHDKLKDFNSGSPIKIFMLPDTCIGDTKTERVIFTEKNIVNQYKTSGSLGDWQNNIIKYCVGNSFLLFALMVSMSGPFLQLTTMGSGGPNLFGESSSGKSTSAKIGASFWGPGCQVDNNGQGFVQQWRATICGLEGNAAAYNGTCLFLDELGASEKGVLEGAIYMLSSGLGKAKMKRNSKLRQQNTWIVSIYSTAELKLADKIREDGGHIHAGQSVRIFDVEADAGTGEGMGIFENLHGFPERKFFVEHLEKMAVTYYGTASRVFLQNFMDNLDKIKEDIRYKGKLQEIYNKLVPKNSDNLLGRIISRVALYVYAGLKAVEWDIFGSLITSDMIYTAAQKIIKNIISTRGGVGDPEEKEIIKSLFFGISKYNQFFADLNISLQEEKLAEKNPYVRLSHERELFGYKERRDDCVIYYLLPARFDDIFKQSSPKKVGRFLKKSGILQTDDDRHFKKRSPSSLPKPWGGKRMYVFRIENGEPEENSNNSEIE